MRRTPSRYHARVTTERKSILPLIALLLLVPAPSIGASLALLYEPTAGTTFGKLMYGLSKLWIVALPALWLLFVERSKVSLSPAKKGGFGVAIALGIVISLVILGTYALLGDSLVDTEMIRAKAAQNGLDSKWKFLGLAAYLALVNSVLEEYVWRWFVFRQCEKLLPAKLWWLAVVISAMLFTAHHVIALKSYVNWPATILASTGVFIGGAVWSWCYLKYRSVWPGYVSHLIVDAAILYLAWQFIFG